MKLNKKIFYGVFVLLIIGLFVISGCNLTTDKTVGTNIKLFNWSEKDITPYEKYSMNEITQYIEENDIDTKKYIVYRESTHGELIPGEIYIIYVGGSGNILPPERLEAEDCDIRDMTAYKEGIQHYNGATGKWENI